MSSSPEVIGTRGPNLVVIRPAIGLITANGPMRGRSRTPGGDGIVAVDVLQVQADEEQAAVQGEEVEGHGDDARARSIGR